MSADMARPRRRWGSRAGAVRQATRRSQSFGCGSLQSAEGIGLMKRVHMG
jgi:hypothetical protein